MTLLPLCWFYTHIDLSILPYFDFFKNIRLFLSSINFSNSNFYKINVTTSYKLNGTLHLHGIKTKKCHKVLKIFSNLHMSWINRLFFFFVIPTWMLIDSKEKFSINGYLLVLNNISQPSSMYNVLANLFTNLQIQKEITRYMYNKHSIQNLGISM